MSLPKLSSLALSLGLIFAGHAAQAQSGDSTTVEPESAAATADSETCVSTSICFTKRWIYVTAKMGSRPGENDIYFQKMVYLINNAKTLGYTGIALSSDFGALLSDTPDNDHRYYQANLQALVELAKTKGVDLIPVGATPDLPLIRHPELIEAVPVNKQTFVVKGQEARLKESTPLLKDGDFAIGNADWAVSPGNVNGPVTLTIDDQVYHDTAEGPKKPKSAKFTMSTGGSGTGYARLIRSFWKLKPHTAYRVSFWVKTSNFKGRSLIFLAYDMAGNPVYNNASGAMGWGTNANGAWNTDANAIKETQEWTQYNLDINTLNNDALNNNNLAIQFRVSNAPADGDGALWLDDVEIREVGLPHPVRRDTLPFKVTSLDGFTTYKEDVDYTVAPEKLVIIPTGQLKNGQEVLVSSFQSAKQFMSAYTTPASACSSTYFDEQKAAYDKISQVFKYSSDFFVYHDEWRVMNWDPACNTSTAGAYLASTTVKLLDALNSVKPVTTYIWNDMYDPYANAQKKYFAVNGDLTDVLNKENGLTANFTIMNWIESHQAESLKYFSDRDFKQMIALDYGDDRNLTKTRKWLDSLTTAETNGVKDVNGFMYTTWTDLSKGDDYGRLQKVTDLIRQNYGRYWPTPKAAVSQ